MSDNPDFPLTQMHVAIGIPARVGSSRLPEKPLVQLMERPLLGWVLEEALRFQEMVQLNHMFAHISIFVATDSERILEFCAREFPAVKGILIADPSISSGTERIARALEKDRNLRHNPPDLIVNWQVDEPGFSSESLLQVLKKFTDASVQIATPITEIRARHELFDVNVVKVVCAREGKALYFSRQCIPYQWNKPVEWLNTPGLYWRHVGIYAFRRTTLEHILRLPPSPLEQAERLEQLRWLHAGIPIHCVPVDVSLPSIDTPHDVALAEEILSGFSRTSPASSSSQVPS